MAKPKLHFADADQREVLAARQRLQRAREVLDARPRGEVVDVLAAVFDGWNSAESDQRVLLAEQHSKATGFSRAMVEHGLEIGLASWTGDALRELVDRELGPQLSPRPGCQHSSNRHHLAPFERTSVLLAGSIPMSSLLQCLLPLVLGSPVLARCSARDPVTPWLVARSLSAVDEELGRCLEVVSFSSADRRTMASFLESGCVVASGSDETLRALGEQMKPHQRLVGYGHRLSLGIVGPHVGADEIAGLAEALSIDISLWDQLGCLSPVAIYVVDFDDASATSVASELASALADALAERQGAWPRGPVDVMTASSIAQERSSAEMRAAAGEAVVVHASAGTLHTVIQEPTPDFRPAPLHRFVRLHAVGGLDELAGALRPLAPHIAAVATAGFGAQGEGSSRGTEAHHEDLQKLLSGLGVSRVCRPGSLQAPPLDWHHDGRPLLLPLARFIDFEYR